MPTVACLHHLEDPFTALAGAALEEAGLDLMHVDLRQGDPLPSPVEVAGILSFGGEQSVTEIDRYPYLLAEVEMLRAAAAAQVPVLGVCLGAQLLAHALGGEVRRMRRRMVEWVEVDPLPAATGDPVCGSLPRPMAALHWNEDCFRAPPGAVELLTRAGPGVEAFRHGACAWGVQFHAEVDGPVLERWYAEWGKELGAAGVSEARARDADARHLPRQRETAAAFFGGFGGLVSRRAADSARPAA